MRLTIRQMLTMNFQPAPDVPLEPELPLLEKQAIVDQCLRHQLQADLEYYPHEASDGTIYYVTRGWPVICAIRGFTENKFPTWDVAGMQEWKRIHGVK